MLLKPTGALMEPSQFGCGCSNTCQEGSCGCTSKRPSRDQPCGCSPTTESGDAVALQPSGDTLIAGRTKAEPPAVLGEPSAQPSCGVGTDPARLKPQANISPQQERHKDVIMFPFGVAEVQPDGNMLPGLSNALRAGLRSGVWDDLCFPTRAANSLKDNLSERSIPGSVLDALMARAKR